MFLLLIWVKLMSEQKIDYDQYKKPIMAEFNIRYPFITKKLDGSFVVQSQKDSYCEGYFVNFTKFGYIVMTGDYGCVVAKPSCLNENVINWMAGATSVSYFAEKVHMAYGHQKVKEFSSELATESIKDFLDELLHDESKKKKVQEFKESHSCSLSPEDEWTCVEFIRTMQSELDEYDLFERIEFEKYSHSFLHQHKCLVFLANKILNDEYETETPK